MGFGIFVEKDGRENRAEKTCRKMQIWKFKGKSGFGIFSNGTRGSI